jgi:6-phosphofructokinase 1
MSEIVTEWVKYFFRQHSPPFTRRLIKPAPNDPSGMKKVGILTSGGDAPGMNAAIRAAVRTATGADLEVVGIRRGFAGLINGEMIPLDRSTVYNIIHQGGTVLGTSRSPEFEHADGRAKAIRSLGEAGIDGLILIGGDGTFMGGTALARECDIGIIGVPGTIDNDVYGTDYTIGFDTAVNCAIGAIDRIRDTSLSHERLFFVEVMGRHSGFIALESGIAGGAEEVLIPEAPLGTDGLCSYLTSSFSLGKRSAIVVVAEADHPGRSFTIAAEVRQKTGFDSRVCVLGHIQRGGSPTARDRVLGSLLGTKAVQALLEGRSGVLAGEEKGEVVYTPLEDTWQKQRGLDSKLYELLETLSG